jgi:thiol-disulfide isomerase/thioredoxin
MVRATAILVSVFAFLSCAPNSSRELQEKPPVASAEPNRMETATAVGGNSSAVASLAALGLTVFPEPQPIPDIELVALDGTSMTLSAYEGKYVFLNFWATWCPPCREEMPSIQRMNDALAGEDFGVFAISVGEKKDTVASFLKSTPYTFPIALDESGAVSSMFAGRGIPTTYILDRQGRAIAGIIGARPWDGEEVFSTLKNLMDQK